MNTRYRFVLLVTSPDGRTSRSGFAVDAFEAPQLSSYDLCSEPLSAMMAGGVLSTGAARIDADRKSLAQEIASKLANAILDGIKKGDTKNGYPQ